MSNYNYSRQRRLRKGVNHELAINLLILIGFIFALCFVAPAAAANPDLTSATGIPPLIEGDTPGSYPTDPTGDFGWVSSGGTIVAQIKYSFDAARTNENSQLGTSVPMMTMPTQAEWDSMIDAERALWLINQERIDRGVLPLYGIEDNVMGVAQYYADYLMDNNVWGHYEDGYSPWERLDNNPAIHACHDNLSVSENLAYFVTSGSSLSLTTERAIHMFMYNDSGSSWGHRHCVLWYPYNDNSGPNGKEGFLGIGKAEGPYQGWNYGHVIVMNVFDPCVTWQYEKKIDVMAWVPPYAIEECKTAVQADFGDCDAKDGLTRVGLQFWTPNSDGTIKYANHEWYTPTDADVTWWRNWCTSNGIQCLLTIYNNDGSWNWPLAQAAFATNRTTFVNALVTEMDRLSLDGIDIDLEGIGDYEGDRSAFDQFIHDLWVELDTRGKVLTVNSFHYIWNAPNHNWWVDWLGEVDNIHAMGYEDLYEGGTSYHQYSFQQNAGYTAGYDGNAVLMGMPSWLTSWGTTSGRGTSALAHVQEVRFDLAEPTGIAIWDLQLSAWQGSDLWCEIKALKNSSYAPEMNVKGNNADISDEDASPSLTDHTDFGHAFVDGGTIVRTYTIENVGEADLNITGISISGTNSTDFNVTDSPDLPAVIAPFGSATFDVTFDPGAEGVRTADVSIDNDDVDENPYNFTIQGTGALPPEINITGNSITILDGDSSPDLSDQTDFGSTSVTAGTVVQTYTIENSGAGDLIIGSITFSGTHASDFSVTSSPTSPIAPSGSSTFDVTFNPSGEGVRTPEINIGNNDGDENPYNFAIRGTGITAPEINIKGNGLSILDEDSTPSASDHTDFGDVTLSGGALARTYTIENIGDADLTVDNISIGGLHSVDFSVTSSPVLPAVITPSGSTTFEVTFDPGATGTREAQISIGNDDSDENPYDFYIHGNGVLLPEMNVKGLGVSISDGDSTPDLSDNTNFGNAGAFDTIVHTFTIENTGDGELTLGNITFSGDTSDFSVTDAPASPVYSGESTTFDVSFSPAGQNLRESTVSISNNDGDENPYNFAIQGNKVTKSPEMSVEGNGNAISDGDSTPSTSDNTDFSDVLADGGTAAKPFTIRNTGSDPLTIGSIALTGSHASNFSITSAPSSSVAKNGGSTTFEITFDPNGGGIRTAEISVVNNDLDENPYNFAIQGKGVIYGDVNGDGTLDLADAIIALQILSGVDVSGITLNPDADCNGDGKIGTEDAVYIIQKIGNLR